MIDLIDIKIHLQHKPFGNERIKLTENSPSSQPISKRFSMAVTLGLNGSPIDTTSMNNGSVIHIRCCPLKPLQGHNVFGTNNVCLLGSTVICSVLDRLGIPYTHVQREAWQAGDFIIDAIDITQRFALPENASVTQIFQHMRVNLPWAFRPAVIPNGTGIRLTLPRRNATWLFYDKLQQLMDRRTHARQHLQAVVGDDARDIWNGLRVAAGNSVRAELKLSKQYLLRHRLNRGSAWTIDRVHTVYRAEMEQLRFQAFVPLRQLRHKINSVKLRPLRQTLELWARGVDLTALCTKSTLERHRSQIRRLTGIDIMVDVPLVEPLPLARIFSRANKLKAFPTWARKFPACAFGCHAVQQNTPRKKLVAA